jgi:hypothetical protein
MKAGFNTTTTYLIVGFGMMTFIFFGVNSFLNLTYSADVVVKDIEMLNVVDAAHMIKSCLESGDGVINSADVSSFSLHSCESRFPGLPEISPEYMIEDLETGKVLTQSSLYDYATTIYGYPTDVSQVSRAMITHIISIDILDEDGDIHLGRIHVQAR